MKIVKLALEILGIVITGLILGVTLFFASKAIYGEISQQEIKPSFNRIQCQSGFPKYLSKKS